MELTTLLLSPPVARILQRCNSIVQSQVSQRKTENF